MNKKFQKLILLPILTLIIGLFLLNQNISYAEDLELIGNDLGLVMEPEGRNLFDLSNLNPGDTREGKIWIKNNYEEGFALFMGAERISQLAEGEKFDLLEQLIVTVYLGREEIYKGPIKDFAIDLIELGRVESGEELEFRAEVHLPGAETGNEFQGKEADVKWIFVAQADQTLGEVDPPPEVEEPLEVEKPVEPIEVEKPVGPKEVEVPRKPIISLPKTGESSNLIYILIGAILLILGVANLLKKEIAK